jgi:hypothetical protein
MNYAESDLVENLETGLSEVASSSQTAVLENTYAYDAAFMVGYDQPPSFIDGTSRDTEALESYTLSASEQASATIAVQAEETSIADEAYEVEQLTVEQASKILGVSEEQVKVLIKNDTLCCSDKDKNDEPRLSAACVRAQAGKSKLEFVQEIKRLIAGENNKKRKTSVDMPANADVSLQELFDRSSRFGAIKSVDLSAHNVPNVPKTSAALELTASETALTNPASANAGSANEASSNRQTNVRGIDRADITNKNLESVLENLDFSSVRLEGAMYRIGYLEAKLDDLQKELQILPELRTKWAKSLILERENEEYRETIAKREHELLEVHQMLDKIKESWWCRAWCWFTGITLK